MSIWNLKKQNWGNKRYGKQERANRVKNKRKTSRLEMSVIEEINRRVEQLAKENLKTAQCCEPSDCAQWQWDILMEQEDELEMDED